MEKPAKKTDDRQRCYAFLVYADSSYPDWMQRLDQLHIPALISPLHDQDKNPDGSDKKAHWHVMLMFEGKKSLAQIDEIREKIMGPDFNKKLEDIGSMRGYARYLCHLDNPEKAQYSRADVKQLGGADYDAIVTLPSDDARMLRDIMRYIRDNKVRYFSDFLLMCADNNNEWYNMLITRKSYVVIEFIKSEAARAEHERRAADDRLRGRSFAVVEVDRSTGEVLEREPPADADKKEELPGGVLHTWDKEDSENAD